MAISPKALTLDWTTTLEKAMMEFWARRQADAEDLPHGLGVEPHLLEIQVQRAGILHHAAEHQGGGDALGDHGGDGHTCHVQLADDDEEEIQHDVDDSRQGEEVQRPLGIALRPQQGAPKL